MNTSPLISVIVPVYKVEKYLHTCIQSVINQTYEKWELILVDDGSPDNCPQICDEYAAKDNKIKAIHKENGGVASARNVALDIATGDYISFLDSDDFWCKEYLEKMLYSILKNEADIAQCSYIRGTLSKFPGIKKKNRIKIFDNHSIFLKGYAKIILWAKLYKRCLFEQIKMPIGKFFEDDFTTWKLYYKASKIVVMDLPLYYYTENEHSTMAAHIKQPNLDFIEAYKERIEFFNYKGEKDLEEYSRGHLCKALLLISGNQRLSVKQRNIVDTTFKANWQIIKYSENIGLSLKFLFLLFIVTPKLIVRFINFIR